MRTNIYEAIKNAGNNVEKSIPFGDALESISNEIDGIQKGRIYTFSAYAKTGLSKLIDYATIISPYIYAKKNNINIKWLYLCFESNIIEKQLDYAIYFLYNEYAITHMKIPDLRTKKGLSKVEITSSLILGKVRCDNNKKIIITNELVKKIDEIIKNHLIPLFGEFDIYGNRKGREGLITFFSKRITPMNMMEVIEERAKNVGKDEYFIVITDNIRTIDSDGSFGKKNAINQYLDNAVVLKNKYGITFIHGVEAFSKIPEYQKNLLHNKIFYPTFDSIRDIDKIRKDSDYIFTMFNQNDSEFNIKYFGKVPIKSVGGKNIYNGLITLSLIGSNFNETPSHFPVIFKPNQNTFIKFKQKTL